MRFKIQSFSDFIAKRGPIFKIVRDDGGTLIHVAEIDPAEFTADEIAANLPFRYAEAMHAALQNEFGRADPPPPPADLGSFAGVRIPDWLADKAQLLRDSAGKEARERTMAQNEAVAAFVAYCDAEGIALAARRAPAPDDLDP